MDPYTDIYPPYSNELRQIYPPNGQSIDLNNYFPSERCFNSVVFIHKKVLEKDRKNKIKDEAKKAKKKEKKLPKEDKCQQFTSDIVRTDIPIYQDSGIHIPIARNDTILEQTMRFAKNLAPLVIPPNNSQQPMYYTIKATKKSRTSKTPVQFPENTERTQDLTYKKEKSKKIESHRTERIAKESFSVKETLSYSSRNDTLNELNIDPSLCCSFSDLSDQKRKKDRKHKKDGQKILVSESFEALATEYFHNTESKIKVHLMNDSDKSLLTDNIKNPILNAVKECILEINNRGTFEAISTVQRSLECNTQKLDALMEKMASMEKKMDEYFNKEKSYFRSRELLMSRTKENTKKQNESARPKVVEERKMVAEVEMPLLQPIISSTQNNRPPVSALELLEDDIIGVNVDEREEQFVQSVDLSSRSKNKSKSTLIQPTGNEAVNENLEMTEITEENRLDMSGGVARASMGMGVRPSRTPNRYCWTNANPSVARNTYT